MKIFGFHDNSGCAYYRITMPLDALAHYGGHQVQTSFGWTAEAMKYPTIIGQRFGKDDGESLPIWRRLRPGRRLIYETDDDMFTIDPTNVTSKAQFTPSLYDAIEFAIGTAHVVTVSTPPLARVMEKYNPNVVVLPNCIDGKLLTLQRPQRERITIGWTGGTSHLKDWGVVAPHLKRFLKKNPDVELHTMGTDFAKVYGVPARNTDWHSNIWHYYPKIDFDIGIAPLDKIPFNRSKSHIKALEYAALGIPVVATDSEPYHDFVVHGETGFLVQHDHEWTRYLNMLVQDEKLRKQMGANAKDRAVEYTIQRRWKDWENAWLGG